MFLVQGLGESEARLDSARFYVLNRYLFNINNTLLVYVEIYTDLCTCETGSARLNEYFSNQRLQNHALKYMTPLTAGYLSSIRIFLDCKTIVL